MEPEREIEKLLRQYGRKRRAEGGDLPGMHPATRRLLQSEVARRSRPGKHGFFADLAARLRPRIAVAAGAVALAVIAGWLIFAPEPKFGQEKLALKRPAPASSEREALRGHDAGKAVSTLTSPAETSSAMDKLAMGYKPHELKPGGGTEPRSFGNAEARPAQPPGDRTLAQTFAGLPIKQPREPAAPPSLLNGPETDGLAQTKVATPGLSLTPQPGESHLTHQKKDEEVARELLGYSGKPAGEQGTSSPAQTRFAAAAAPAAMPALPSAGRFYRLDDTSQVRSASQRFVQIQVPQGGLAGTVSTPAAPSASAVLSSFKWVQNGQEVRIVDQDGSVYKGLLQAAKGTPRIQADLPVQPPEARRTAATARALVPTAHPQLEQNYAFSVSGTNRTLNQEVVFRGYLVTLGDLAGTTPPGASNVVTAGAVQAKGGTAAASSGSRTQSPPRTRVFPLANFQIRGTAVINDRKRIEINALPVPSQPAIP